MKKLFLYFILTFMAICAFAQNDSVYIQREAEIDWEGNFVGINYSIATSSLDKMMEDVNKAGRLYVASDIIMLTTGASSLLILVKDETIASTVAPITIIGLGITAVVLRIIGDTKLKNAGIIHFSTKDKDAAERKRNEIIKRNKYILETY